MNGERPTDPDLCQQLLHADEELLEYFARRSVLHDAVLFTCDEAPAFNIATVDAVPPAAIDRALNGIVDHYLNHRTPPRVRLSPANDARWLPGLARAGFVETGERRTFWHIPSRLRIPAAPSVSVIRGRGPDGADLFSSLQGVGFGLSPAIQRWDRRLARRHIADRRCRYYIGWWDGMPVGAVATRTCANGAGGIWGLTTRPEARRRGIARTLLARASSDLRTATRGPVFLTTAWSNPVERLYRDLGLVALFRTRTFELHMSG